MLGPALTVLAKEDEAWPNKPAKEGGYAFHGYRLTPDERPTFLYAYRGVKVEDFPNAVAGKVHAGIRRELTLTGDDAPPNLYFRAAAGSKIEPRSDGWYLVNNEWKVRIESAGPVRTSLPSSM